MSVALITRSTSRVEHLGSWAYDPVSSSDAYDTGRYVPLCGQERNHGSWRYVAGAYTDVSLMPGLKRKRLCLRCRDALRALTELVEPKEDHDGDKV